MALADAVLVVADAMEKTVRECITNDSTTIEAFHSLAKQTQSYIRELRTAVKAAEGQQPIPTNAADFHRQQIDKHREEFRGRVKHIDTDGSAETHVVEIADGDGTLVHIPCSVKPGERIVISGQEYQLALLDGRLHPVSANVEVQFP